MFNVTDQDGNKVTDEAILDYIRKVRLIWCSFNLSGFFHFYVTLTFGVLLPFIFSVSWPGILLYIFHEICWGQANNGPHGHRAIGN